MTTRAQQSPLLSAPQDFVSWLADNRQHSKKHNGVYNYHSRSDSHSIAICRFVVLDLYRVSELIRQKAKAGRIAFGINAEHEWLSSEKKKTLDLVIGIPKVQRVNLVEDIFPEADSFSRVLFSCEEKTCMTEHKKSQPRIFDELGSSHQIVHKGDDEAIAAGLAIVNIAPTFVSPLRQSDGKPVEVTKHRQPAVAESMITHLRGLPIRDHLGENGFDAFATVVVNCCNDLSGASLHTAPPAPQPGDKDHYETFVLRVARAFEERFSGV